MLPQISGVHAKWHNASVQMKGPALNVLVLASTLVAWSSGQELDTALLREKAVPERSTIIDQVADAQERRAFLKLYGARDPQKRYALAEAFLAAYPQSWLLPQVYEIAAKAAIDLGDYAAALRHGAQSLRLLPENPLLLVPLANVQAQLGQLAEAQRSAQAGLEYLDEFDRPAGISAAKWLATQAELKASAYYVLGKVAIANALRATGGEKQRELGDAEDFLMRARQLNEHDTEIVYLLGLTELSSGKQKSAAFHFAEVRRTPGPLKAKAEENLRRIYEASADRLRVPFTAFVEASEKDGEPKLAVSSTESSAIHGGGYAGSGACQPCHAAIYKSWQETGMSRMLRPYRPENVMGDFRVNNQFSEKNGTLVARMTINREKHYFAIRDLSGAWQSYPVDYTIGSKWQQAYATRLPTGDIHVFPVQYSKMTGKWVNYWKIIDPPGSPRTEVTGFPQLSSATSYEVNCAPCHTSQLHVTQPAALMGHGFEFSEGGINCEMCHGPGERHVRAMSSGMGEVRDSGSVVDFSRIAASKYVAVCGQCHAQSALRQAGPNGEMNYPPEGSEFPPTYLKRPFTEISRRAFYLDGRFRETTFIVEAFRRTACFRKGQAHCGHCHQPHASDASSNLTSLKFPNDPDRMCLECHSKFAANPSAHTHHAASHEASRCVSCHMPRIMNSVLFKARTHQIDDIPSAEMTRRFGPEESPNACLLCHADKDAHWVELKLQAW